LWAGKHVVCEKPMADSLSLCDQMIETAESSAGRLFIVQNRVYTDAMQTMRRLIDDGAIGDIQEVRTQGLEGEELLARMPSIREDERGVIATQAVHQTYVVPWLIDRVLNSVEVSIGKRPDSRMKAPDATAEGILMYEGIPHRLHCTFEVEGKDEPPVHTLEVIGTRGSLYSYRDGPQHDRKELLLYRRHDREYGPVHLAHPEARSYEFSEMWRDYLDAIAEGRPAKTTTESARRSIDVVESMYRSAELGMPVAIATRPSHLISESRHRGRFMAMRTRGRGPRHPLDPTIGSGGRARSGFNGPRRDLRRLH